MALRWGLPALAVIGGMAYLLHAADSAPPPRHETRIELAHALDD
jgi:hypothetical protein